MINDPIEKWVQVDSEQHYDPIKYLPPSRMASIAYQYRFMAEHFPKSSVLEIGVGAGLTTAILRQIGHSVTTLDVDNRLKPDLTGSITDLPCSDHQFNTVLCCQVLEHLPWDTVDTALQEMNRVVDTGAVVSVPTNQPTWLVMKYDSKSSGTRRIRLGSRTNKPMRVKNGEHYWELEANIRTSDFRIKLKDAGFKIVKELQPFENMFHHFFILKKT